MAMPVVLFPLGWDQSTLVFLKPLHFAGFSCCRRNRWNRQLPFFCADSPPWSNSLDSNCLPTKRIGLCSSFDCGRQAQGEWGLDGLWWTFHQIWGDDWKVMMVHIANQCWWLWNYNSTKGGLWNDNQWSSLLFFCLSGARVSPSTLESVAACWRSCRSKTTPCHPHNWTRAVAMLVVRWKFQHGNYNYVIWFESRKLI